MKQQVGFGGFSIRELERHLAGVKVFTYFEQDSRHLPGNFAMAWLRLEGLDGLAAEARLRAAFESQVTQHPHSKETKVLDDALYLRIERKDDILMFEAVSSVWGYWGDAQFAALRKLDALIAAAGIISLPVPKDYPFRPFTRTDT